MTGSFQRALLFFCRWMNCPQKTKQNRKSGKTESDLISTSTSTSNRTDFADGVKKIKRWQKAVSSSALKEADHRFPALLQTLTAAFLILAAGEVKVSRVTLFIMQCSAESVHRLVWLLLVCIFPLLLMTTEDLPALCRRIQFTFLCFKIKVN